MTLQKIKELVCRITLTCLDKPFKILVAKDQKGGDRIYLQVQYESKCTKTGKLDNWKGRKWYLSEFMTDDEVVKTAYCAFEAAVKHEVMEGFKVDGKILFNPHINFEALLSISDKEIYRDGSQP